MKTPLLIAAIVLGVILAPLSITFVRNVSPKAVTTVIQNEGTVDPKLPASPSLEDNKDLKLVGVSKTLILEASNTVILRGPVTVDSVSKTMLELKRLSRHLSKDTAIYLVLDTPGGSVLDGLDLIDFANALPQKIHTVTLFAASMGFQIAQNLDTRYIIRNGVLMSHRATLGGLGGQIKGELESRYRMLRRSVDYLDFKAAQRMGIPVDKYEAMIVNEYWVHGFDAVTEGAADQEVLVRCGDSLNGTDTLKFDTFFGPLTATVSKCPLVKGAISVDASGIFNTDEAHKASDVLMMSLDNKRAFIKEYISTGKYAEIFR